MFYKFYAKHRTYLVTLEFYSFHLVAIKYCDVKDKNMRNAYHKIFNDQDAYRVIGTCFHIMHKHWQRDPNVNFVFYASLRDITDELLSTKTIKEENVAAFKERYSRARYSIYRYGMVNLFPYDYFTQLSDKKNCVYVLINKKQTKPSIIIDNLKAFLLKNHDIIFSPEG